GPEPLDLGAEAAQLLVGGGGVALAGEGGLLPLLPCGGAPAAEAVLADAEAAGHLGDGKPLVRQQADGLELELSGVGLAGHRCPPRSESTPLTRTPPSLGKLIADLATKLHF